MTLCIHAESTLLASPEMIYSRRKTVLFVLPSEAPSLLSQEIHISTCLMFCVRFISNESVQVEKSFMCRSQHKSFNLSVSIFIEKMCSERF